LGADESLSIEVINYLKENRFLDEKRFVEAYVQGKVRIKKWGRQKIKAALYQKRIDAKLIQEGIYAFISDEEYQLVLESLIERKNRELSTEKNPQIKKQKLMRFLLSRGFQYDEFSTLNLD
jgi:regulatory protein